MAKLPNARPGKLLDIKAKRLAFSFWPVARTTRRYGLQPPIYADNPWTAIRHSITTSSSGSVREEARASAEQSEYLFRNATSSTEWAAKPLSLYYGMLNLAKAFALVRGVQNTFARAMHGIAEKLPAGGKEITDGYLELHKTKAGSINVFDEYLKALTGSGVGSLVKVPVSSLLAQILPGHRLWCQATNSVERFVAVRQVSIMHDEALKLIWILLRMPVGELSKLDTSAKRFLSESRLGQKFQHVRPNQTDDENWFEMKSPIPYSGRPSDRLVGLVAELRPFLWCTATAVEPYRKYYVYRAPLSEQGNVVSQLASLYLTAYYLGSITRYRPQHFGSVMNGPFGGFVQEFLTTQPRQFLYLMASEFAKRDVVRAALA